MASCSPSHEIEANASQYTTDMVIKQKGHPFIILKNVKFQAQLQEGIVFVSQYTEVVASLSYQQGHFAC